MRHDLVLEIGRHSAISTRSPSPNSPDSTCAWYLRERVIVLPIIASHTAFHPHHHRLLHLVAGHPAHQLALVLGRGSLLGHFAAFSLIRVRTRAMSRRTFFNWLVLVSCWVASCMRSPNCARSRPSSSFCSSSPLLPRSSVGSMSYPSMRCTTMVRNGSFAAASAKASLASTSVTPSIS